MQIKDQRSCAYILYGVEKVKVMEAGLSRFHSFEIIKKKKGPSRMSSSNPETEIHIRIQGSQAQTKSLLKNAVLS